MIVHTYKRYTPYFFLFRADNSWTRLPNWVPRTATAQLTVSRLFKELYLRDFDNLVAELCRCARDQLNVESCLAETVLGLPPHSFVNPASRPTQRAIARRFLELTDYLPTPDARQEGDKGKGAPVLPSAIDIPGDESDDDDGTYHFHPHPPVPRAPARLYDTERLLDHSTTSTAARSICTAVRWAMCVHTLVSPMHFDRCALSPASGSGTGGIGTSMQTRGGSADDGGKDDGDADARDDSSVEMGDESMETEHPDRAESAHLTQQLREHSNAGNVRALAFEEWLLNAVSEPAMREEFMTTPCQAFSDMLHDMLREAWSQTGLRPFLCADADKWTGGSWVLGDDSFVFGRYQPRSLFARYIFAVFGRSVSRDRERRIAEVEEKKREFYATQLFSPLPTVNLVQRLADAYRYSTPLSGIGDGDLPSYELVYAPTLARYKTALCENTALKEEKTKNTVEAYFSAPSREAKEGAPRGSPLLVRHPKGLNWMLSHESVAILRMVTNVCNIAHRKALFFQYAMFYYFFREIPDAVTARQFFTHGDHLTTREYILQWRDDNVTSDEIASSPGLWHSTSDASRFKEQDRLVRRYHGFNEESNRPEPVLLTMGSIGAKTASVAARDFFKAAASLPGLRGRFADYGGGLTDNANGATAEVVETCELINSDVGEIVNGVVRRSKNPGDPIHKEHLHMKWGRAKSFGGKTDMHEPNHFNTALCLHLQRSFGRSRYRSITTHPRSIGTAPCRLCRIWPITFRAIACGKWPITLIQSPGLACLLSRMILFQPCHAPSVPFALSWMDTPTDRQNFESA